MDRLTEWTGYIWIPRTDKRISYSDCMEKLARYENAERIIREKIEDVEKFEDQLPTEIITQVEGYKEVITLFEELRVELDDRLLGDR